MATLSLLVFGGGALVLPLLDSTFGAWTPIDRLSMAFFGIAVAALMWRYASIRAVPSKEGLLVRNLVLTRKLDWAQIVRVQFGGGAPWVSVDLDDTDTVAIMAIQRSDGPLAKTEAARLAALVQVNSEPGRHSDPGDLT